jgi:hypothetical protein
MAVCFPQEMLVIVRQMVWSIAITKYIACGGRTYKRILFILFSLYSTVSSPFFTHSYSICSSSSSASFFFSFSVSFSCRFESVRGILPERDYMQIKSPHKLPWSHTIPLPLCGDCTCLYIYFTCPSYIFHLFFFSVSVYFICRCPANLFSAHFINLRNVQLNRSSYCKELNLRKLK